MRYNLAHNFPIHFSLEKTAKIQEFVIEKMMMTLQYHRYRKEVTIRSKFLSENIRSCKVAVENSWLYRYRVSSQRSWCPPQRIWSGIIIRSKRYLYTFQDSRSLKAENSWNKHRKQTDSVSRDGLEYKRKEVYRSEHPTFVLLRILKRKMNRIWNRSRLLMIYVESYRRLLS